jgi:microcystin-dependent protein
MTGRIPMGAGTGSGLTARVLGLKHGAETVTLTSAQSGIPAHAHTTTVGTQSANHTHGPGSSAQYLMWDGASVTIGSGASAATPTASSAATGIEQQTHTHAVTVNANSAANAASSHPNIPPATVLNAVIKI